MNLEASLNDSRCPGLKTTMTATVKALEHGVESREDKSKIDLAFTRTVKRPDGKLQCPTDNCNRTYTDIGEFHGHIRKSPGNSHEVL